MADQKPSYLVADPDGIDPDAPMTEKQAAELRHLCEDMGKPFDGNLTAGQADERIAALKEMKDA